MFNWAVVGTGTIVKKFIKGLSAVSDAKVYAVCSRNFDRAESFAKEYDIECAYGSLEELVQDDNIDCIYIGVPHALHKEYMELCIRNHKNVLCEKPFTINAREAKEIRALAKENKVFVMEAMWTKFLPVVQKVKKYVLDGGIGDIKQIKASFGFYTDTDVTNRLYDLHLGGGALLDVGVYPLEFALYIMEDLPDKVSSEGVLGSTGVDEINHMELSFDKGRYTAKAILASALKENQGADAVITGTKGSIFIPEFYQADKAYICDLDGDLVKTIEVPHLSNGYEYEAIEVQNCIRSGRLESTNHTLYDTVALFEIADTMRGEWGLRYPADV